MGSSKQETFPQKVVLTLITVIGGGIFTITVALISRAPTVVPTPILTPGGTVVTVNFVPTTSQTDILTFTPQPSAMAASILQTSTTQMLPVTSTPSAESAALIPTSVTSVAVISQPTAVDTPVPFTKESSNRAYPCEATVIAQSGSYATTISEVRLRPNITSRLSPAPANPLRVGATVVVERKDEVTISTDWYEIRFSNDTYLGWIEGVHLRLSDKCPE